MDLKGYWKEYILHKYPEIIATLILVNNIMLLKDIFKILEGRKSKIVLYTYDAILLDLSKEDKDAIRKIVNIFEEEGLRITMNVGNNYNALQSFWYV